MRVSVRREGKLKWIVLKATLIAGDEEIARFVKEEMTQLRLAQKNGLEAIVQEAQKKGLIAYIEEEKNEKTT